MIRRLLKEIVAFPLLALNLCISPLIVLGIWISNTQFRRTHQEIVTVLEKNESLEKLLAYAREQNVLFSKHRKQVKGGWFWSIVWIPPSRTDTLLGKYNAFLGSIDDARHRPVIYVQVNKTGNIQPKNDMLRVHFLSHELGHLRNEYKGRKKCSWAQRKTCLKDELLATLAGIKILMELGYSLDFPSLAYQWTTSELMTGRCVECIRNALCQDALKDLLAISPPEEKTATAHTVNYNNIFEAVNDL